MVPLPAPRPPAPLPTLCTVSVADAATLRLHLYDPSVAPALEAALRASPMRLQPRAADGGGAASTLLVSVPPPSDESRQRVLRLVRDAGEAARASGRRLRQDAFDATRASSKAGAAKDDIKKLETKLQAQADKYNKEVLQLIAAKEKES